jgi:hypothetical protein
MNREGVEGEGRPGCLAVWRNMVGKWVDTAGVVVVSSVVTAESGVSCAPCRPVG